MNYDFISRSEITNYSFSGAKKTWLTIGVLCLFIAMILEFIIGQKFAIIFIVPLIYLLKARSQAGTRKSFGDVSVRMCFNEKDLNIIIHDVIIKKREKYKKQYKFSYTQINTVTFDKKTNILRVSGSGFVNIVTESDAIKHSNKINNDTIALYIPDNISNTILTDFENNVFVIYT